MVSLPALCTFVTPRKERWKCVYRISAIRQGLGIIGSPAEFSRSLQLDHRPPRVALFLKKIQDSSNLIVPVSHSEKSRTISPVNRPAIFGFFSVAR